jgi:hypothetical protein
MQIFKNKILSRILSVLLIAALIIGMDQALGYLLEPVDVVMYNNDFGREITKLERSGEKADAVFVGTSRTARSIAPEVFEDKLGLNCVINAGCDGQSFSGSYYQLKDLIERTHPDRVYIEVTIDRLLNDRFNWRLLMLDRLSLKNKLLMALNCFSPKDAVYFFKTYRYNDHFSLGQMKTTLEAKAEMEETRKLICQMLDEYYAGKGFVYSYSSCASGTIRILSTDSFSREKIAPDKLKYLNACVELCKKNNIDVALFTGVTSVMRMYACDGFQDADEYCREYAEKNGIKYYNLNYMKDRETLLPDECMKDYNHSNGEGAMAASKFFAEVIKAEEAGEDTSQYFYANLDEFKKSVKRIVAVGAEIQPDEERENILHISITSLQNDDVRPQYRVSLRKQDEEEYTVAQDWTAESEIEIEIGDAARYTIKVEAAAEDPSYGTARQEYTYEK